MSARKRSQSAIADLAAEAIAALERVDDSRSVGENRQDVVDAAVSVERIAKRLRGRKSGRDVILELLKAASPAEVTSDFLRHASGIQEFARRIRELRVEFGYDIEATTSGYRLLDPTPDVKTAEKWRVMNEIRKRKTSASDRIRELFEARLGEIVTTADIVYVSKISSGPRRVRELRTERGLRIESDKENPALHPGQYVLVDRTPIPASERAVDARQRQRILERDQYSCVQCGRGPDRSKRRWLEVDHIVPLDQHGDNEDENLRTLCNDCHRARTSSG